MFAITSALLTSLALVAVPTASVNAADPVVTAAPTWSTANTVTTGEHRNPAIAANRNGSVAVAWEDDRDSTDPGSNYHSEVYLRVYRDGGSRYEKKVSTGGSGNWRHVSPDVGLDDNGNAVVVWAGDPDGNGSYQVYYRVLNTSGTVTASGTVNSTSAGQQIKPKVGVDPDGAPQDPTKPQPPTHEQVAFTVVWQDTQTGQVAKVKAAGFTKPGTRAWEVVASHSTGRHFNPDIAVSGSGYAVIVWQEDADDNGYYNVGLVRLARTNGAADLSRRVANANGGGQQLWPTITANLNGEFALAWESDHTGVQGVWTRSFTRAGSPRHSDIEVSSGAGARLPSIGIDDQNNTVVGWTVNAADTWVRGFNPNATTAGRLPAQPLMQVNTGPQQDMVVAVSAWGEVSVAYRDDRDANTWGQISLGLGITNSNW